MLCNDAAQQFVDPVTPLLFASPYMEVHTAFGYWTLRSASPGTQSGMRVPRKTRDTFNYVA